MYIETMVPEDLPDADPDGGVVDDNFVTGWC